MANAAAVLPLLMPQPQAESAPGLVSAKGSSAAGGIGSSLPLLSATGSTLAGVDVSLLPSVSGVGGNRAQGIAQIVSLVSAVGSTKAGGVGSSLPLIGAVGSTLADGFIMTDLDDTIATSSDKSSGLASIIPLITATGSSKSDGPIEVQNNLVSATGSSKSGGLAGIDQRKPVWTWTLDRDGCCADVMPIRPGESLLVAIDFTNWIGVGDTVSAWVDIAITGPTGGTAAIVDMDGNKAVFRLGVTKRGIYRISATVLSVAGETFQASVTAAASKKTPLTVLYPEPSGYAWSARAVARDGCCDYRVVERRTGEEYRIAIEAADILADNAIVGVTAIGTNVEASTESWAGTLISFELDGETKGKSQLTATVADSGTNTHVIYVDAITR